MKHHFGQPGHYPTVLKVHVPSAAWFIIKVILFMFVLMFKNIIIIIWFKLQLSQGHEL